MQSNSNSWYKPDQEAFLVSPSLIGRFTSGTSAGDAQSGCLLLRACVRAYVRAEGRSRCAGRLSAVLWTCGTALRQNPITPRTIPAPSHRRCRPESMSRRSCRELWRASTGNSARNTLKVCHCAPSLAWINVCSLAWSEMRPFMGRSNASTQIESKHVVVYNINAFWHDMYRCHAWFVLECSELYVCPCGCL